MDKIATGNRMPQYQQIHDFLFYFLKCSLFMYQVTIQSCRLHVLRSTASVQL